MTTGNIVDFREAGLFVLQDHDDVEPADRLQLVGVRIIAPKGSDDPWAGHVIDDDETGGKKGTAGDIHPWRFFSPGSRDTGMWSMGVVVGRVTDAAAGRRTKDKRGRTITPGVDFQSASAKPLRTTEYDADGAFMEAEHETPTFWPAFPKGYVVGMSAGTREDGQENLLVSLDPRLVAVNKNESDRMGSFVCDLSPADTISEQRAARLQTLTRVAHIPSIKVWRDGLRLDESGLAPHWTAAWQHTLTGQGGQCGLGSVYGVLEPKSGGGAPNTPKDREGPAITPTKDIGPGGASEDPGPGFAGGPTAADLNASPGGAVAPAVRDAGGGVVNTGPQNPGGDTKKKPKGPKAGIGLYAREAWGPMHVGCEGDKHQFGTNEDKEPVNSGHLDPDRTMWFRDDIKDGPLEFDRKPYDPVRAPMVTRAWIRWDDLDVHDWNGEIKQGRWRLVAESFFTGKGDPPGKPKEPKDPDPPPFTPRDDVPDPRDPPVTTPGDPPPPPFRSPNDPIPPPSTPPGIPPPTTPGGRGGGGRPTTPDPRAPGGLLDPDRPYGPIGGIDPGSPGFKPPTDGRGPYGPRSGGGSGPGKDSARYVQRSDPSTHREEAVAWAPTQLGFSGALAFPQHFDRKDVDLRYSAMPSARSIEVARATTPAVARMMSWGKQSGDTWAYNQRPGYSRVPGGTASGGIMFGPPEIDEMDRGDSFAPAGVTKSTTYVGVTPCAYFGWGVPQTTDGDLANGSFRAGITSSKLAVQSKASGTWSTAFDIATGLVEFTSAIGAAAGVQFVEQGSAPAFVAERAIVYAEDDGSDNTRLRVIFESGTDRVISHEEVQTAKTADYTVTSGETGKTFTTDGAAGTVIFTLPAAAAGLRYTFIVMETQILRVARAGGDAIFDQGGTSRTTTEAAVKGRTITLEATSAAEWYVVAINGSWTFA